MDGMIEDGIRFGGGDGNENVDVGKNGFDRGTADFMVWSEILEWDGGKKIKGNRRNIK